MINYLYPDLVRRLDDARSWAVGVTEGNRCALVVGVALNLKPATTAQSFRSVKTGVTDGAKGQPFLEKFYVKAQDLANDTSRRFGPPDLKVRGELAIEQLLGKQGVLFLEDCWGGLQLLGIELRQPTYDHIDLWDGATLEIYKGKKPPEAIRAFVRKAKSVWLWEVKRILVST